MNFPPKRSSFKESFDSEEKAKHPPPSPPPPPPPLLPPPPDYSPPARSSFSASSSHHSHHSHHPSDYIFNRKISAGSVGSLSNISRISRRSIPKPPSIKPKPMPLVTPSARDENRTIRNSIGSFRMPPVMTMDALPHSDNENDVDSERDSSSSRAQRSSIPSRRSLVTPGPDNHGPAKSFDFSADAESRLLSTEVGSDRSSSQPPTLVIAGTEHTPPVSIEASLYSSSGLIIKPRNMDGAHSSSSYTNGMVEDVPSEMMGEMRMKIAELSSDLSSLSARIDSESAALHAHLDYYKPPRLRREEEETKRLSRELRRSLDNDTRDSKSRLMRSQSDRINSERDKKEKEGDEYEDERDHHPLDPTPLLMSESDFQSLVRERMNDLSAEMEKAMTRVQMLETHQSSILTLGQMFRSQMDEMQAMMKRAGVHTEPSSAHSKHNDNDDDDEDSKQMSMEKKDTIATMVRDPCSEVGSFETTVVSESTDNEGNSNSDSSDDSSNDRNEGEKHGRRSQEILEDFDSSSSRTEYSTPDDDNDDDYGYSDAEGGGSSGSASRGGTSDDNSELSDLSPLNQTTSTPDSGLITAEGHDSSLMVHSPHHRRNESSDLNMRLGESSRGSSTKRKTRSRGQSGSLSGLGEVFDDESMDSRMTQQLSNRPSTQRGTMSSDQSLINSIHDGRLPITIAETDESEDPQSSPAQILMNLPSYVRSARIPDDDSSPPRPRRQTDPESTASPARTTVHRVTWFGDQKSSTKDHTTTAVTVADTLSESSDAGGMSGAHGSRKRKKRRGRVIMAGVTDSSADRTVSSEKVRSKRKRRRKHVKRAQSSDLTEMSSSMTFSSSGSIASLSKPRRRSRMHSVDMSHTSLGGTLVSLNEDGTAPVLLGDQELKQSDILTHDDQVEHAEGEGIKSSFVDLRRVTTPGVQLDRPSTSKGRLEPVSVAQRFQSLDFGMIEYSASKLLLSGSSTMMMNGDIGFVSKYLRHRCQFVLNIHTSEGMDLFCKGYSVWTRSEESRQKCTLHAICEETRSEKVIQNDEFMLPQHSRTVVTMLDELVSQSVMNVEMMESFVKCDAKNALKKARKIPKAAKVKSRFGFIAFEVVPGVSDSTISFRRKSVFEEHIRNHLMMMDHHSNNAHKTSAVSSSSVASDEDLLDLVIGFSEDLDHGLVKCGLFVSRQIESDISKYMAMFDSEKGMDNAMQSILNVSAEQHGYSAVCHVKDHPKLKMPVFEFDLFRVVVPHTVIEEDDNNTEERTSDVDYSDID